MVRSHAGDEAPRAVCNFARFFAALGVPIIAGRDFNELDEDKEPVAIVRNLAQRMFPIRTHQSPRVLDGSVLKVTGGFGLRQRIIGIAAILTTSISFPNPLTVYNTFEQGPLFRGRLFIHTDADPYALVAGHAHHSRHVCRSTH